MRVLVIVEGISSSKEQKSHVVGAHHSHDYDRYRDHLANDKDDDK